MTSRTQPTIVWITTENAVVEGEIYESLVRSFKDRTYGFIDLYPHEDRALLETTSLTTLLDGCIEKQYFQSEKISHIVNFFGLDTLVKRWAGVAPLIRQINFERDILFRHYPFIIIFWTSKETRDLIQSNAPDFWDWLSYDFYFQLEKDIISIGNHDECEER